MDTAAVLCARGKGHGIHSQDLLICRGERQGHPLSLISFALAISTNDDI